MEATTSSTSINSQFTWMEAVLVPYLVLMYLLSMGVTISIVVDIYTAGDLSEDAYLYILFLLLPHVFAGVTNLSFHHQEVLEGKSQPNWILYTIFLPISPLIRYQRAWRFGRKESTNPEYGERFIREAVIVGVLRLVENFWGDAPIAVLLLKDDVWRRSAEWELLTKGNFDDPEVEKPELRWNTIRLLLLISQIGQTLTLYKVMNKRYLRITSSENPEDTSPASQGKTSFIGCLLLFGVNYAFVGSRLLGYSLVATSIGFYVLLVIALKWVSNTFWNLIQIHRHKTTLPSLYNRYIQSFVVGGLWILGLTNERDESQLWSYLFFYFLASIDTAICSSIWFLSMKGTGDFFTTKAIWATLIAFGASILLLVVYYLVFHQSHPLFYKEPFKCCARNQTDPLGLEQDIYNGYHNTYTPYKDSNYYRESDDNTSIDSHV